MCAHLKKCGILSSLGALFVCLCAYMCAIGEECASRCLIICNVLGMLLCGNKIVQYLNIDFILCVYCL